MSNDVNFAPNIGLYRSGREYRELALAWITARGACSQSIKDFCMAGLVVDCFVPLRQARCGVRRSLSESDSLRRMEEQDCTDISSLSCEEQLECSYGDVDSLYDYQWRLPFALDMPGGYIIPLAEEYALTQDYTCAGSAFLNVEGGSAHHCLDYMVGDGNCDQGCDVVGCQFDGGDCDQTIVTCQCDQTWLGDGYCDLQCNTTLCDFDYGDCQACAPGCPRAWQGDNKCDPECFVPECGNDTAPVVPGCLDTLALNFVYAATVDDQSCVYASAESPRTVFEPAATGYVRLPHCHVKWGAQCTLSTGGDCETLGTDEEYCAPGCKSVWIGDKHCDPACNTASCADADGLERHTRRYRRVLKLRVATLVITQSL
eukprot:SAG11_NODE_394_length_9826_cov_3.333607_11_plen_372_part_00